MTTPKHPLSPAAGHRKRLRERYLLAGNDGMTPDEKLELLLTYALPRIDVKPLARTLLRKFGSVSGILNAPAEDVQEIPGAGPSVTILFSLVRGMALTSLREKIHAKDIFSCSPDVLRFARMRFSGARKELFLVLYLNARNEILSDTILAEGTVDHLFIHPRELIAAALRCGASSMILVHNHPSGTETPSEEDILLTASLRKLGDTMSVRLLDHLVVTQNASYSILQTKPIPIEEEDSFRFSAAPGSFLPQLAAEGRNRPVTIGRLGVRSMAEIALKKRRKDS